MMSRFYQPDLGSEPDSPFARDANDKLIRRSYWLDMNDRSLVLAMTQGLGANLTNDEKRAHPADLKREHLLMRYVFKRFCHLKERKNAAQTRWHFCNLHLKWDPAITQLL